MQIRIKGFHSQWINLERMSLVLVSNTKHLFLMKTETVLSYKRKKERRVCKKAGTKAESKTLRVRKRYRSHTQLSYKRKKESHVCKKAGTEAETKDREQESESEKEVQITHFQQRPAYGATVRCGQMHRDDKQGTC